MSIFTESAKSLVTQSGNTEVAILHVQLMLEAPVRFNSKRNYDPAELIMEQTRLRLCGFSHELLHRRVDEFSLDIVTSFSELTSVQELTSCLKRSFATNGVILEPEFRVGMCLWNGDMPLYCAISNARRACYEIAPHDHHRIQIFDLEGSLIEATRTLRQQEVLRAIEKRQIALYLQAKVDLQTSKPVAFEALARWITDSGKVVPPLQFLPTIEGTDIEKLMGYYVVQQTIETVKKLNSIGCFMPVNMNISPRQLTDRSFAEFVQRALKEHHLDSTAVGIEILESEEFLHLEQTKAILNEYSKASVSIALDDFGTGYASLSYLVDLPINEVKIDRLFVVKALENVNYRALIKGIVKLAKEIGLLVTAEGIETIEQHKLMSQLGVDFGQGYLYSKPISCEEVMAKFEAGASELTNTPMRWTHE